MAHFFKMSAELDSDDIKSILAFNIPEGMLWGDYFCDSSSRQPETQIESDAGDDWEVVKKTNVVEEYKPVAKWCRDGNACQWKNCKFRHERCAHYDSWIQRGKKGYNCRCHATDPESCKSPEQGGCKYDHRDLTKLKMFIELVPCSTESELWNSFVMRGLEYHAADGYDVSNMARLDRALLVRSLTNAQVKFEDLGDFMNIYVD